MAANTTRYIAKVLFTNGNTCSSQEFSREAAEAYIARFEIGGRIEAVRIDEFAEGDSVRWSW